MTDRKLCNELQDKLQKSFNEHFSQLSSGEQGSAGDEMEQEIHRQQARIRELEDELERKATPYMDGYEAAKEEYRPQIIALEAERDKLIQAVADHVTVRAEQFQKIQVLDSMIDHQREECIDTERRLLAELNAAKRDAAEAQALVAKFAPMFERTGYVGSNREFAKDLNSIRAAAFAGKGNALTTAIEEAKAEEREACAAICRARALKMEAEASAEDADQYDIASLRATAWQLSVAEDEIRARGQA